MNLDSFAQGGSLLHRLDPRAKFAAACGFAVVVAVARDFQTLVPALGLALGLVLWARLGAGPLLRRLLLVNSFVALLWLFLPFNFPGEPAFRIGPLTASRRQGWPIHIPRRQRVTWRARSHPRWRSPAAR